MIKNNYKSDWSVSSIGQSFSKSLLSQNVLLIKSHSLTRFEISIERKRTEKRTINKYVNKLDNIKKVIKRIELNTVN